MKTAKAVSGSETMEANDTTPLGQAHAVSSFFSDIFMNRGISHLKENGEPEEKEPIRPPKEIVNEILGHVYHNVPERRLTLKEFKNNKALQDQLNTDKKMAIENRQQLHLYSTPDEHNGPSGSSSGPK